MPRKKKSQAKKKKLRKKSSSSSKKVSLKDKKVSFKYWYLLGFVALLILLVLFSIPKETVVGEDKAEVIDSLGIDVAELFNCEGKNKFQSDCWRKIQVIDKATVHEVSPGDSFVWRFAFMNRLDSSSVFSYSISSLAAADLVREACPLPAEADEFIISGARARAVSLDADEFVEYTLLLSIPEMTVNTAGCPYRYVLEVKEDGRLYERETLNILVN